jgi:glycosyltransferase involved in cell wall biosynthesis
MASHLLPTVALFPFGHVFEDFLDSIGVSLEEFCTEMTGGWLFGYVEALRSVGVTTVVFLVVRGVGSVTRRHHKPTGTQIVLLPAPRVYRRLRRRMTSGYAHSVAQAFATQTRRHQWPVRALMKELAPYLATPAVAVARELRRQGCTAVLCQEYEFPRFDVCAAVGRLLGLPVFATFQGGDHPRGVLERWVRPTSLRAARGLISAPREEVCRLRRRYRVPHEKIARIPNPLDMRLWPEPDRDAARRAVGLPPGARVAVWHGRVLFASKGVDLLVDAWQRICRQRSDRELRLVLLGTGPDAANLERLLNATGLTNVTWINSYIHDRELIRTYLCAGDVYAFPSRHEGFPVAPLEAMACGLPLVAADAEGIAEILEGGELAGGIIVPRNDSAAMATALAAMIDDPEKARGLGKRARQRVEACYSLESVGRQLRTFLGFVA